MVWRILSVLKILFVLELYCACVCTQKAKLSDKETVKLSLFDPDEENYEFTVTNPHNILCKYCGSPITSVNRALNNMESSHSLESFNITVYGYHLLVQKFQNPQGSIFNVVSVEKAHNVQEVGNDFSESSWFSGYSWTITICSHCQRHLGWTFKKLSNQPHSITSLLLTKPDYFVGLILNRLMRPKDGTFSASS